MGGFQCGLPLGQSHAICKDNNLIMKCDYESKNPLYLTRAEPAGLEFLVKIVTNSHCLQFFSMSTITSNPTKTLTALKKSIPNEMSTLLSGPGIALWNIMP